MKSEVEKYLKSKAKQVSLSRHTRRIIHFVNLLQLGVSMDYDDFSPKELWEMEYVYLRFNQAREQNRFETLFDGLSKLFQKVMKAFK